MIIIIVILFHVIRDTSMADVSERIQRMEFDLREATTRYDRCVAELQVTNTLISLAEFFSPVVIVNQCFWPDHLCSGS